MNFERTSLFGKQFGSAIYSFPAVEVNDANSDNHFTYTYWLSGLVTLVTKTLHNIVWFSSVLFYSLGHLQPASKIGRPWFRYEVRGGRMGYMHREGEKKRKIITVRVWGSEDVLQCGLERVQCGPGSNFFGETVPFFHSGILSWGRKFLSAEQQ